MKPVKLVYSMHARAKTRPPDCKQARICGTKARKQNLTAEEIVVSTEKGEENISRKTNIRTKKVGRKKFIATRMPSVHAVANCKPPYGPCSCKHSPYGPRNKRQVEKTVQQKSRISPAILITLFIMLILFMSILTARCQTL